MNELMTTKEGMSKAAATKRILLVEDDSTFVTFLGEMLRRIDPWVQLDLATNEVEARFLIWDSVIKKKKYDLVITDIYLESFRNGLDLWKSFHEEFGEKMIVISSIDYGKMLELLGETTLKPFYLKKPLDAETSMKFIKSLLQLRAVNFKGKRTLYSEE